jgi:hypothetical protein
MEARKSTHESYERGRMLRQAKVYDRALADLSYASHDPQYAGKAHTQEALCLRAMGRQEEAVVALRLALDSTTLSPNERLYVLYLLGLTLETLGRYAEALEAYGWVRHKDAAFRDVESRIKRLCAVGSGISESILARPFRAKDLLTMCRHLTDRSLSLFKQTHEPLSASTAQEKPCRNGHPEQSLPRRGAPLVASGRPAVIHRNPMVQRRHSRVAIYCQTQFASKTEMVAGEGTLRDLSPGGCRLTTSIVVPMGTELVCWIFPPNELEPFTIEAATVRWSRAHEFGVAFTNVPPSIKRQIALLCANPK